MINKLKVTTLAAVFMLSLASHSVMAAPISSSGDAPMLQFYKANEKYACTPQELADFMSERRKSLTAKPNIMTASQFTENEIATQSDEEESCLTLFDNLDVVKEIQDLVSKVQDLSMPDFSTDGMGMAAQELAKRLYDSAMDSVCNALTKEAAAELINEIMSRELGFDIDDMTEFDPKGFAKDVAMDHSEAYLSSKGIDPDWLDNDNHQDLMKDEIESKKNILKEDLFKDD